MLPENCYGCNNPLTSNYEIIQLSKYSEDYPSFFCSDCADLYTDLDVNAEMNFILSDAQERADNIEKHWLTECKKNSNKISNGNY